MLANEFRKGIGCKSEIGWRLVVELSTVGNGSGGS